MALARSGKIFILIGLAVALVLAILVSPFASPLPDGLEKVAQEKGFSEKGEGPQAWKSSPVPDYAMPGLGQGRVATAAAGLAGTVIVFAAAWGLAFLIRARSKNSGGPDTDIGRREKSGPE